MVAAVSSLSGFIDRASGVTSTQTASVTAPSVAPSAPQQASFSDMMAQLASSGVDSLKAGEAASIAGINGKASVQQVVQSVMSAEQTLQIAIAVRDKIVSAYQEISRMTI
jgi:flagellar hook-basal body complex protein FliE